MSILTATILPFEPTRERAARASMAALSPERREAVMELRAVVLALAEGGRAVLQKDPLNAILIEEMAATVDGSTCALMGFATFSLKDIPEDIR